MQKLLLSIIIVLVFIFTISARTTFTSSSGTSYSSALKRRQGRAREPKTRLEAYRCVLNVYKREKLIQAKNEACRYINDGKKTWGFSRWPKPYKPPNRQQFPFYSNTFRLWPLEHDGKIFKGGVVALYKSKATLTGPCPIIGCHAPVVKEYKNCEPMKVSETTDSEQPEQGHVKEPRGRTGERKFVPKKEAEPEAEETEEEEREDTETGEEDEEWDEE